MKRVIKWLLLGIFVVGVLSVGWVWHRTAAMDQAFDQVQRGDSPARVIELFGEPPQVSLNLETNDMWLEGSGGIRSVRQFHFYPPFSICGESWHVGFDESSKAVSKYHIVSP